MREANGLLPSNYESLNSQFYDRRPWEYFMQRLSHLVLVASNDERHRARLAEGIELESTHLSFSAPAKPTQYPSAQQTFAAIEAQVLLHHAAESLLRLVHAHAVDDPCPWLRMSRHRYQFKDWVKNALIDATDVDALSRRVLLLDEATPEQVQIVSQWLRQLATEFVDGDAYNAAKHGMAVNGASELWTVDVGGLRVLERKGETISWLALRPDDDGEKRWATLSRMLSVEATVGVIFTTTTLMQGIYQRGRSAHLGETPEAFAGIPALRDLYEGVGVIDYVLQEQEESLAYANRKRTLTVRARVPRDNVGDEGV